MKTAIHWFRRDLRLTDNTALSAALAGAECVVPVYILSDWLGSHRWTGPNRQQFLCDSLSALSKNLEHCGGSLILRRGNAVEELEKLIRESKAGAIYFNRDPDLFGRAVEEKVVRLGRQLGVEVHDFKDVCLHERDEVLTAVGTPYRVFTAYAKAWTALPKEAPRGAPRRIRVPPGLSSHVPPTLRLWNLPAAAHILPGGEAAARERMKVFLEKGLPTYGTKRDLLADEGTSRLSQDLRFGLLSIRELYARCHAYRGSRSAQKFVGELVWREFYMNILWHFPEVLEQDFNPQYRKLKWEKNRSHFERWATGQTGFPIVDAAMRQLAKTGFMHNRARMITAMFLTKDLHLHWKEGEGHFMHLLVDGEIASNNGGWQWSAGTGADAAPYFRIQNPWTQAARFDPNAEYIRRWIPELRDVPIAKLLKPSEEPIARGYPAPIVDHARERQFTLDLFRACRDGFSSSASSPSSRTPAPRRSG